jgi:hypothetical protein
MFSPLHHHHLRPTTERINIKKNFRGGGFFLNFIKQNYTDFEEEERLREFDSFVYVFTITSSSGIDREKKIFF